MSAKTRKSNDFDDKGTTRNTHGSPLQIRGQMASMTLDDDDDENDDDDEKMVRKIEKRNHV